jgi:hypothetical protein
MNTYLVVYAKGVDAVDDFTVTADSFDIFDDGGRQWLVFYTNGTPELPEKVEVERVVADSVVRLKTTKNA